MRTHRTQIARDPFARVTLMRDIIGPIQEAALYGSNRGCTWCGNHNANGKLFSYGLESDGGGYSTLMGLFCSVGCLRTYHDGIPKGF